MRTHRFRGEWNEIYSTHLRGCICVQAYANATAAPRGHRQRERKGEEKGEKREEEKGMVIWGELSIFPAASATCRKPGFSRENTRPPGA